jgi:hypothetical protein
MVPVYRCRSGGSAAPVVVSFRVVGRDLDHRPVAFIGALGRLPGEHPLPHVGFHQAGGTLHGEGATGGMATP